MLLDNTEVKIVGTLTTMPHRYAKLKRTLQYLQQQTHKLDEIYVGIPKKSRRLNKEYPDIPDSIKKLCTIVELEEDLGPITKIIAGLQKTTKDDIIISFDDDVIYPPDLVEKMVLLKNEQNEKCAIGGSGFLLNSGFPFYGTVVNVQSNKLIDINRIINVPVTEVGREVDILCGFAAIMYRRNFFEDDFFTFIHNNFLANPDLFLNDDITISGYLSYKNIKRKVFPIPGPLSGQVKNDNVDESTESDISYDKLKFLQRFNRAVKSSKELGFFKQTSNAGMNDTVVYKIFLLILMIIIFIFLLYMCYLNF